jgi:hypothetical protein
MRFCAERSTAQTQATGAEVMNLKTDLLRHRHFVLTRAGKVVFL